MNLFKEPAAAVPTFGVLLFMMLLAMSGAWFWFALGGIAALLLIVGAMK